MQQTAGELSGDRARPAGVHPDRSDDPPRPALARRSRARAAVELVGAGQPRRPTSRSPRAGDADVIAAPGAVARELVELLVHALEHATPGEEVELAVAEAGGQAVVCAVPGAGELRLPIA